MKPILHYAPSPPAKPTPRERLIACFLGFFGTLVLLFIGWLVFALLIWLRVV